MCRHFDLSSQEWYSCYWWLCSIQVSQSAMTVSQCYTNSLKHKKHAQKKHKQLKNVATIHNNKRKHLCGCKLDICVCVIVYSCGFWWMTGAVEREIMRRREWWEETWTKQLLCCLSWSLCLVALLRSDVLASLKLWLNAAPHLCNLSLDKELSSWKPQNKNPGHFPGGRS